MKYEIRDDNIVIYREVVIPIDKCKELRTVSDIGKEFGLDFWESMVVANILQELNSEV